MTEERLQKLLARAGLGSRRSVESLIEAGRVTIDGRVATLGEKADPERQRIALDGRPLTIDTAEMTLALYKPYGVLVTAHDEHGRPTVYDVLADAGGHYPASLRYVGRLDYDSEGLLLLTTDGDLAHRLTHPRYHVRKGYEATLDHLPAPADLERLARGIELSDGMTAPAELEVLRRPRPTVSVAIHEGRNRQVRRMFEAVGVRVTRLVRTRVGNIGLGRMRKGEVRALSNAELQALRTLVGLAPSKGRAISSGDRRPRTDGGSDPDHH